MVTTWTYQVLLSCPGDVHRYFKDEINDAVNTYNKRLHDMQSHYEKLYGHRIAVEITYWHDDGRAVIINGQSGQDVLNNQIVYPADGTIAMFYTRLGTPTDKYQSGTVEEIEKSLELGKHVAVIPVVTETLPTEAIGDGTEYVRLKQYLKGLTIGKKGLVIDCSQADLKQRIMEQLDEIVLCFDTSGGKYKDIKKNNVETEYEETK